MAPRKASRKPERRKPARALPPRDTLRPGLAAMFTSFDCSIASGPPILHVGGDRDAEHCRGVLHLAAEEIGHPEEEYLFLPILLVNDGVPFVKVAEGLGQLEGV